MSIDKKTYDSNFTVGGLLYQEIKALGTIIYDKDFEKLIKIEEEQNNVIGIATKASRKKFLFEISRRFKLAPRNFLEHFSIWNEHEQKLGLFYLCLKTYPLMLDIHFEVTLKRFRTGTNLEAYDIHMRMEELMSYDETVASWSATTFKKLNARYRKILKDVGMYNGKTLSKPTNARSSFWDYFKEINEYWFLEACFMDKN